MKKSYFFSLAFLAICTLVTAQDDGDEARSYVPKSEDLFFYDLTYVMYADAPEGVDMNAWPSGHSLSLMKDWVLGKSNFSVAVGLGYTSNNYRSNLATNVDIATGETQFAVLEDEVDYDKNKINMKYLEIPIELRFRTRPNAKENFFRIYAGLRGGWNFANYSQFETEDVDVRFHDLEEISNWRLGAYGRIGYSAISLYAYYGLVDVFDYDPEGDVPDMTGVKSMAFGLSFSF